MPKFKNSNATYWVIFKHCTKCLFIAFYDSLLIFMKYNSCTIWKWCVGICYDRWNMLTMICRFVCDDLWGEFFKYASELRSNLNDHCVIGIRCAHFFCYFSKLIWHRNCMLKAQQSLANTLFEKSNFCQKIQFWQNPNILTSFSSQIFWQFFSWKQSCQQLKNLKPQHFRDFFTQKIDNFFGKSKLNFWTKHEDFEQCVWLIYRN